MLSSYGSYSKFSRDSLTFAYFPDTIKVRLQAMPAPAAGEAPMFRGAFDCFSKTCKSEGVRGDLECAG
mgnify:CR=1 FL=1